MTDKVGIPSDSVLHGDLIINYTMVRSVQQAHYYVVTCTCRVGGNGVVGVARRSHSCKLGEICSTAGLDVRIRQLVCVEAVVVVPKHALVPSIKCKK